MIFMTDIFQKSCLAATVLSVLFVASACGKRPDAENCEEPKTAADDSKEAASSVQAKAPTPIRMNPKDVMWCRSCVVGPHGFMSCQSVTQSNLSETVDELRDRARIAACVDSGFTKDNCPASGVISVVCKGDPPPADKTAAGKAMLDALKNSGPVVLTKEGKTVPNIMHQPKAGPGAPASTAVDNDNAAPTSAPTQAAPHVE
jgi:hypothetical protein